jgi:integral membrane sensor domain MASE1
MLALAAGYCVVGRLALLMAIPPGYATAVWPAAGLALAALLLLGDRMWPGVMLGSFFVNVWTSLDLSSAASVLKSVGLATSVGAGAALQAVVGARLVRRFVGHPNLLDREQDVIRFLVLGGPVGCLVSASVGVATLCLAGVVAAADCLFHWWTWWVGDTIGVVIFAPLILLWTADRHQVPRRRQLIVSYRWD